MQTNKAPDTQPLLKSILHEFICKRIGHKFKRFDMVHAHMVIGDKFFSHKDIETVKIKCRICRKKFDYNGTVKAYKKLTKDGQYG